MLVSVHKIYEGLDLKYQCRFFLYLSGMKHDGQRGDDVRERKSDGLRNFEISFFDLIFLQSLFIEVIWTSYAQPLTSNV